jgi:hypothetical protein
MKWRFTVGSASFCEQKEAKKLFLLSVLGNDAAKARGPASKKFLRRFFQKAAAC